MTYAFFFGAPGWAEMLIIGVIALLLFGKRLPEVARSLGKGLVEFKKGVRGIEDEVENAGSEYEEAPAGSRPIPEEEAAEMTAPKFEPPKSAPSAKTETAAAETGPKEKVSS